MKVVNITLKKIDIAGPGYGSAEVAVQAENGEQRVLTAPIFVGTNNFFTGDTSLENLESVAWVCDGGDDWAVPHAEIKAWESQIEEIEGEDFDLHWRFGAAQTVKEVVEALLSEDPDIQEAKQAARDEEIEALEAEED